jgi:hypothetical protein
MNPHDEPLTPEERDLARRLARVDGGAEPSPALDARILAAARGSESVAPSPVVRAMPTRRRPRFAWAAGLGVAASLMLAVGIAWQLRPQPDADVQYSEAPVAADAVRQEAPAEVRAPEAFPASPMPSPPPPPPPQQPKSVSAEPAASAPAQEARARRQFSPPPAQESRQKQAETAESGRAEAPVVFDEPSPVDALAPPAAAPIPPPPESAPREQQAASEPPPDLFAPATPDAAGVVQEETAREHERKASAKETSRDAARQRRAESLDRVEITGSRIHQEIDEDAGFDDQPYDDEPPASADSPEVRTAWLARIRELLGEGKIDAARASLAEFHRRYPDAPLPDDLRPLLQ